MLEYDLPLDRHQRGIADRVLAEAGAPFDPSDRDAFESAVDGVWRLWQRALDDDAPPLTRALGALHHADRLLHDRGRPEHVDDTSLPDATRERLMRELDRLNRTLGVYRSLARAVAALLASAPAGDVEVLDVGSGHGAFPVELALRGAGAGHRLRVTGSDLDPAYVEQARALARRRGAAVDFRVLDATRLGETAARGDLRADLVTCTQTLHHLPPPLAARFLAEARAAARRGVLFLDARRSPLLLVGVAALTFALSAGNRMFVHDGVVSVRRMYSPAEIELLARCAPGGERYRARNVGIGYVLATARC